VRRSLLVLFTTGSVFDAGVIAAAGRIGILSTTLWGGAMADRVSRRLILIAVPLAQAALMSVVASSVYAGHVLIPLLAGASLVDGALVGILQGATLPALRRIVPREQFAARAAQEQGLHQAAQLAGSPLAAFLFTASRWLPFAADAVSFVFAATGAALIRRPLGPDRADGTENEDGDPTGRGSVLADIGEGLRFVRRQEFLRYMVALLMQRGAGPQTIGVTSSAVAAGGILGSVLAGLIIRRLGSRRVFLLGGWSTSSVSVSRRWPRSRGRSPSRHACSSSPPCPSCRSGRRTPRLSSLIGSSAASGLSPTSLPSPWSGSACCWSAGSRTSSALPQFPTESAALKTLAAGNGTDEEWAAMAPFSYGRWDAAAQAHQAAQASQTNREGAFDPGVTRAALATFAPPTLLLAGEDDVNTPPPRAAEFARLFSHAELVVQSGAAHFPWLDDAHQFVATTASFLAGNRVVGRE